MKEEVGETNGSESINRIAAATAGGVQRGKGMRQITAGMVIRIATDEGNAYTYKTGWRIGGAVRGNAHFFATRSGDNSSRSSDPHDSRPRGKRRTLKWRRRKYIATIGRQ